MTETTADTLREEYLARLDEAMRGLPHGVASDIRGGIVEELQGLDAADTAARIARLGDPVAIARRRRTRCRRIPRSWSLRRSRPRPRPDRRRPRRAVSRSLPR
ncbi:hypothetical protein ACCO44_07240 [Microbacterium maritypicum]|uniref:HAAS signaling domain-containing protein n=1 Tax=Microbacterium maritypicum TaxID=33918 RepID=UPI003558BA0E